MENTKQRRTFKDIGGICRFCGISYEPATKDERGNLCFNICPECREERYGEPRPSFKQRVWAFITKPISA
ncbi:hypothetical protein C4544_04195 [candidate division WS5 bacterium]|uniref:Uncharacterized protein n=1 Tax=candidate division WS5 bacterium TaxID=2093353 RepID=A0A419DCR7_9BACT|nr:MAG: hypothetical protein C4544_04195 [candidate division WS5 bacterium]